VNYLPYLTSTVGLVTARMGDRVNVMSAEWTYFVAREPLHIAVCVQDSNYSQRLITDAGQFSVTLCDESLAPMAEFAGSFCGEEVEKCSARGFDLEGPHATQTPHVAGGLLNAECVVRQTVQLPGYLLVIGEAVWVATHDENLQRPLVKHGRMYGLGAPIASRQVVACVRRGADPSVIEVAATAQGVDQQVGHWSVTARDPGTGSVTTLWEDEDYAGDLWVDVALPDGLGSDSELVIAVERDGCQAGEATLCSAASRSDFVSAEGRR